MFQTRNPHTDELIQSYSYDEPDDIRSKIESADLLFQKYKSLGVGVRQKKLATICEQMKKQSEPLAALIHLEMGKPLMEAQAEVKKSIHALEYFSTCSSEIIQTQFLEDGPYRETILAIEPMGLILAIMPWNFPVWQVVRTAVPQLFVGNGVLLKHSEISTGVGLLLEQIFTVEKEKFISLFLLSHPQTAELIAHSKVSGVAFTGSYDGGMQVAKMASSFLKKSVLEFGGSDPYIVLKDSDLNLAAQVCVKARMLNAGQVCISPKRILVDQDVYKEFIEIAKVEIQKVQIGPLAKKTFQVNVQKQVEALVLLGGQVIVGGQAQDGPGSYFPPTMITFDRYVSELGQREVFGPIMVVVSCQNEAEALSFANDSRYGLGAGIFTRDISKAHRLSKELNVGMIAINDFVKSHPAVPFGGRKDSGSGYELGHIGCLEFCHYKVIGCS